MTGHVRVGSTVTEGTYLRWFGGITFLVNRTDGFQTLKSSSKIGSVLDPLGLLVVGNSTPRTSTGICELVRTGDSSVVLDGLLCWTQQQIKDFVERTYAYLVARPLLFCFKVEGGLVLLYPEYDGLLLSATVFSSQELKKEDDISVARLNLPPS